MIFIYCDDLFDMQYMYESERKKMFQIVSGVSIPDFKKNNN